MRRWLKWIGVLLAALVVIFAIVLVWFSFKPPTQPAWGVTFSPRYARFLGLDAGETYHWILGDLGVKNLRFPLYWDEIEKESGKYDFRDADWYLWDAAKRGLRVTLVVGMRSPRWPECYVPAWVSGDEAKRKEALLSLLEKTAEHFKNSSALVRWQVENEPLLPYFGICPKPNPDLLDAEIATIRRVDPKHEIQLTASGELERWKPLAERADVLGISIYRKTWNKIFQDVYYPFPPAFYRLRKALVNPRIDKVIVSELQAEPWFPDVSMATNVEEGKKRFTADDLRANAKFVADTGFKEAYFWGVEWWYFLKKHGDPSVWEAAKAIFQGK